MGNLGRWLGQLLSHLDELGPFLPVVAGFLLGILLYIAPAVIISAIVVLAAVKLGPSLLGHFAHHREFATVVNFTGIFIPVLIAVFSYGTVGALGVVGAALAAIFTVVSLQEQIKSLAKPPNP